MEAIVPDIIHRVTEDRRHLWRLSRPTPMFRPETTRAVGCSGPCPFKLLRSPRIETPQPAWATCSNDPVNPVRV